MKSSTILGLIQTFLMVLGAFIALWGVYDMMQGDGQQSSVGVKKLIGGIAFASISWFILKNSIASVSSAEAQAGISAAISPFLFLPTFHFLG